MRTNIDIDDDLMADAIEALGVTTTREAAINALQDAVRAKRQLCAWDGLRGLGWEGDLDDSRTGKHISAE